MRAFSAKSVRTYGLCVGLAAGLLASLNGCGGSRPPAQPYHHLAEATPASSSTPLQAEAGEVPDWVYKLPSKSGHLCATGAVDPTYFRQDGRVYAAEAARNELARSIEVKINSVMYDVETSRGGSVRQHIVSEVVTAVQDGVVAGAEVLAYWFDAVGAVSKAGMTYALACIDTNKPVEQLANRLRELTPEEEDEDRIQSVRERAKAAFDELEAMEAQRAEQAP